METQLAPPQKGSGAPSLIFGPCLLWSNGWMDQDGTLIGAEVGLGPGHIVLDGNPAPLPKKEAEPQFWAHFIMAKRLHGSRCHLLRR